MISPDLVKQALKNKKVRREEIFSLEYLRFSDDFKDIPRGTAIFKDFVIWGYPHIGRIFMLETGLKEQFEAPFWVEEKVDGYNVRIFKYGNEYYALSRGGFICPFTTDRLPDLINLQVLDENPDLVICAEVAGPENPYIEESPPYVKEDVQLFVFDIMKKNSQEFLSHEEKMEIIEKYNLPSVQILGKFTSSDEDILKIKEILKKFNEEGREGVVFKEDSPRNKRAKYITSYANLMDIKVNAKSMLQLPPEYYTNRVLRIVLFMIEEGLEKTEHLYEELGRAFIDGLFEAVKQFQENHKVYRTFSCKFRKKENAIALLEFLSKTSKHIQIKERKLEKEGDYWRLEFDKIYLNMTGLLGHLLSGGLVYD